MPSLLIHVTEDAKTGTTAAVYDSPAFTGADGYVYTPERVMTRVCVGHDLTMTMPIEVAALLRDALAGAIAKHEQAHDLETAGRPA